MRGGKKRLCRRFVKSNSFSHWQDLPKGEFVQAQFDQAGFGAGGKPHSLQLYSRPELFTWQPVPFFSMEWPHPIGSYDCITAVSGWISSASGILAPYWWLKGGCVKGCSCPSRSELWNWYQALLAAPKANFSEACAHKCCQRSSALLAK